MYSKTDYIHIRTNYRGFIPPLMQAGPIVNPLRCKVGDVISLIMGGMQVYQVDPPSGQSVLLTTENVLDDTKFIKKRIAKDAGLENVPPVIDVIGIPKEKEPSKEEVVNIPPVVEETPTEDEIPNVEENREEDTTSKETPSQHLTRSQRKAMQREQYKQEKGARPTSPVDTQTLAEEK